VRPGSPRRCNTRAAAAVTGFPCVRLNRRGGRARCSCARVTRAGAAGAERPARTSWTSARRWRASRRCASRAPARTRLGSALSIRRSAPPARRPQRRAQAAPPAASGTGEAPRSGKPMPRLSRRGSRAGGLGTRGTASSRMRLARGGARARTWHNLIAPNVLLRRRARARRTRRDAAGLPDGLGECAGGRGRGGERGAPR